MHASSPPPGPLTASIFVEALRAHAGRLVAGGLILHALLWTFALAISEPALDPKIAFGLALGREWPLGYPGMPVLAPSFLASFLLLFANAFSSYATAAALVSQGSQLVPLQIRTALTSETVLGRENLAGALAFGMIVVVAAVMGVYALIQRRAARWQA